MKTYYIRDNIGKCKYTVRFHDGAKNKDGSPFFDLRIFRNKKTRDAFIKGLLAEGYTNKW